MWAARSEPIPDRQGLRFAIERKGRPATAGDALHGWQLDPGFGSLFNTLLADVPYSAFRWETPSLTTETLSRPFEFVVLDTPGLGRNPDAEAFAEHFVGKKEDVVVFPNLGGDSILVVPFPRTSPSAYGHLAAFVRNSPEAQRDALWQAVGEAMSGRVSSRPVWLSTAGAGVSWLHVRLDNHPKYYGFAPYR